MNTRLKQLLAGEKYIYPKEKIVKSPHHYVLSQGKRFWVIIYALCSSMRSQMLYPNRRFEIWQVRMFVRQILAGEKYIYPKAKIVKSLHHYVLRQWNVSEYVFMYTAVAFVHKCFTLTGGLKSDKCECLWSRANRQVRMFLKQPNRQLQQLLAVENTILQQLEPSLDSFRFSTWCSNSH